MPHPTQESLPPIEGESARQGRQPAVEPVGGHQMSMDSQQDPAKRQSPPPKPDKRGGTPLALLAQQTAGRSQISTSTANRPLHRGLCLPARKLIVELDGGNMLNKKLMMKSVIRSLRGQGLPHTALLEQRSTSRIVSAYWRTFMTPCINHPLEGGSKDASLSGRGSPHRIT